MSGRVKKGNWEVDNHTILAGLLFITFAIIYWFEMTTITPWYDELYSYIHFIKQGPIYTATHWPLPNNHIFYNVLSSIIGKVTSNQIIALRGISYLSLLASMIIIYRVVGKQTNRWAGLSAMGILALSNYTHSLGVQGRGYSLSVMLFLVALAACVKLIQSDGKIQWYAIWGCAIALGVYDVPSNLYWVLLLYVGTCIITCSKKEFKKIGYLMLSSAISAIVAFFLYLPVWLTTAAEKGLSDRGLIERVKFGIEKMLSNQYIQSLDRKQMIEGLPSWIKSLGNNLVYNYGWIPIIVCIVVIVASLCIKRRVKNEGAFTLIILSLVCFIGLPILITIQSVLPYIRVMAFMGAVFSISVTVGFYIIIHSVKDTNGKNIIAKFVRGVSFVLGCLMLISFFNYQSKGAFEIDADRSLKTIFAKVLSNQTNSEMILGDENIEQYYIYLSRDDKWIMNNEGVVNTVDQPEVVIINTDQTNDGYERRWPSYYGYGDLPWNYINQNMSIIYKDKFYTVFRVQ